MMVCFSHCDKIWEIIRSGESCYYWCKSYTSDHGRFTRLLVDPTLRTSCDDWYFRTWQDCIHVWLLQRGFNWQCNWITEILFYILFGRWSAVTFQGMSFFLMPVLIIFSAGRVWYLACVRVRNKRWHSQIIRPYFGLKKKCLRGLIATVYMTKSWGV